MYPKEGSGCGGALNRRAALTAIGGTSIGLLAGCIGDDDSDDDNGEEDWPQDGDQIEAVVPYGPGGGYDWYVRTISPYVEEYMPADVDIITENIEGAGGLRATNSVYNSDADGGIYMLRHGLQSVWEQVAISDQIEYDVREFTNLGIISTQTYGVMQHTGIGSIDSWDEFVDAATSYRWGAEGEGGTAHMIPIVLGEMTGAWTQDDLDFVHFGGYGELVAAMEREEVELANFDSATGLMYEPEDFVEPIVQFQNEDDDPQWDDTPNLDEWDVPNAEEPINSFRTPRVWSAPPGLPEEIADVLEDALYEAAEDDDFLAEAEEDDRPVSPEGAAEAQQVTEEVLEGWSEQEDLLQDILG